MKIIDVTGQIKEGMWNYESPFPQYKMRPLLQPEWVKATVWCDIFDGLHSQTGTYLETPAHFLGPEKSYMLDSVGVEKLTDIRASHLKLDPEKLQKDGQRVKITPEMLEEAAKNTDIKEGDALIFSCGMGKKWFENDYLTSCPYVSYEAMEWLVSKKPFILASDIARWDRVEKPEGFWNLFYNANILMLAPLVNLENVNTKNITLTALPINISSTCCAPARAIIKEY